MGYNACPMTIDHTLIRNFSIIAHIDHGKSTLADRLIQFCGAVEAREMKEQLLDNMDIERERGITIKSQTVRLNYRAKDGKTYTFNLMDTPGHVDFAYEVSRCLSACEGALLVVDAAQGVEAQTLANVYKAIDANLEIIPVLNKIDLPAAEPERVSTQIEDVIGIDASDALRVSAKSGLGIEDLMEAIVQRLPAPVERSATAPLKALLIDSWYDTYLGVIILVRVYEGTLKKGQKIRFMNAGVSQDINQVGVFAPKKTEVAELGPGEVGYIITGIKILSDTKVGDTITEEKNQTTEPLAGFKPLQPVVFCGFYPTDNSEFDHLRDSIAKLQLNDASFLYEPESSLALGLGFRCGFLGLLHLEIIQERLDREYDVDLITTAPSVAYEMSMTNGDEIILHSPTEYPDVMKIKEIREPWIRATIMVPDEFLGNVLTLCTEKRGRQEELTYVGSRAMVIYKLPLNEVVFDFYDRLKSCTKGYASFDYEMAGFEVGDLVKLSILVNEEPVDALAMLVHRSQAEFRGRAMCAKLKDLIPKHMFKIPIQAAIGGKVIARETISAMRKDVTAKCYGGDATRKRKLLEKQKKGKKKMRSIGSVDIPQTAFIAALKMTDE